MADSSALTTIRQVVNQARQQAGIPEKDDYKIFTHVLNGMKKLSLFNLRYKNTVKLTPDSLGRVYYPDDCLRFLSVGVPRRGKLWTFTQDKTIIQSTDKTYSYEVDDTDFGEGGEKPFLEYSTYTAAGGTGLVKYYTNERLRYVDLVGHDGTQVVFTYISSGITDNIDGVEIPVIAQEALVACAVWEYSRYNKEYSLGERQYFEQQYINEVEDLDWINLCPTADEMADQYFSTLYQGIKRP